MNKSTAVLRNLLFSGLSAGHLIDKQVVRSLMVVVFLIASSGNLSAQTYRYKFQVEGVTDLASAKEITDPLRTLFNTTDQPFRVFPSFNDERNEFDFRADIDISQTILLKLLSDHALVLTSFVRVSLETSEFE